MTLPEAMRQQAAACAGLGSPFMDQLLTVLADRWAEDTALGRLCADWPGDIGPGGASLPLRLAGGLHALVLSERDTDLAALYPPRSVSGDALAAGVSAALARHQGFMLDWMQSAPQTNEVRRSAVLIAGAHRIASRYPLPFVTSELGASAGLNLIWDRYALSVGGQALGPGNPVLTLRPEWRGPAPSPAPITVTDRRGVDLNPVDTRDPLQALRLFAYLWPDQPHRMELTRAAIAAREGVVDQADAIDWLAPRLETQRPGHIHLIYHTVAWQYFPKDRQALGTRLIEAAGARATDTAPLAWLAMENDGRADGAAVTLRLWPGDHHIVLGRADFHGRWVHWDAG